MKNLSVIKTLPHLYPLFFEKGGITVVSDIYSEEILYVFKNIEQIQITEINFTIFKSYLADAVQKGNLIITDKIEETGVVSIKGDIINFWEYGYSSPIRLEFLGEQIENAYLYDPITGKKLKEITSILWFHELPKEKIELNSIEIFNPSEDNNVKKIIFTSDNINLSDEVSFYDTGFTYPQLFWSKTKLFEAEINRLNNLGYEIYIKSEHKKELNKEFQSYTKEPKNIFLKQASKLNLPAGFLLNKEKIAFFTDRELFGTIYLTKDSSTNSELNNTQIKKLLRQFEGEIELGDFIVHEDYGVGVYAGLTRETVNNLSKEYILIKYADGDELYLPFNHISKITKYIGLESQEPKLTRLGKASWQTLKNKIKKSAQLIARDLVEHYAKRELAKAKIFPIEETAEYLDFINDFEHIETNDQMKAVKEIFIDLNKNIPMNRLLVGDVGFGKTEVILRAAFKVLENGSQVAVLAPTTVLANQHYDVFKKRFKKYGYKVKLVSRYNTPSKNKEIIRQLNVGEINLVIGTHRLLSRDVEFSDLQLLVLDEEQRFGVKQKEFIKKLNYGVHVLSVSATPIPRTLSMALSSIQDISIITTPPVNRLAIQTELIKNNWDKIISVIQKELERGGQIFFLHNKISTITVIQEKLQKSIPGIDIEIAHGQMQSEKLDKIMTDFYHNKFKILVSTTIIENGIDIANVNTIIINDAQNFGLSQLYQLRGRVGRSEKQAYCYLVYKGHDVASLEDIKTVLPENVRKARREKLYLERLNAIVENQDLGAGFKIASKDLEIRGAGSLLGENQHGHINAVGYALYIEILSQEISKLKNLSK